MLATQPILRFDAATRSPIRRVRPELITHFQRPSCDTGSRQSPFDESWPAQLGFWEDAEHFCIEVDLPGVSTDHLDLAIHDGKLLIHAERRPARQTGKYRRDERHYGRIERSIRLPVNVDHSSIESELTNGVLTVRFVKVDSAQPKRIVINGS